MDIQGYMPPNSTHKYPEPEQQEASGSSLPALAPPVKEEEYPEASTCCSSQQDVEMEQEEPFIHPSFWANRFDKRKSSPAILGLPFGLNHETPLSVHLSQQRNSIEAAMLLANFNKLLTFPKPTEHEQKDKGQWQDDMSIPSQKKKNAWDDEVLSNQGDATRRHSYDVNMSWNTMPESFLDRPDLINKSYIKTKPPPPPSVKQDNIYYTHHVPTRVTWSHDSNDTNVQQSIKYPIQHYHAEYQPRMYHPTMGTSSPLVPFQQQQQQQQRFHPLSTVHENQPTNAPMLHPLARAPEVGQKREHQEQQQQQQIYAQQQRYYPYGYPPQEPNAPPPPPPQGNPIQFYYPSGKLPLPASNVVYDPNTPIMGKPKRKKQKSNNNDDSLEEEMVESNEANYPDMATRDVEAARTDPEARPRKQKLRFIGDEYTPQWVRYNGQSKEGLCDTCKPGKWLQLKNSAYWYHKQFYHGISSVSGKEFVQPLETRWVDQDLVEGLCHQCHQWVAVSNVKRKNSVLWYRHAHKCHIYHKPKPNVPKKR